MAKLDKLPSSRFHHRKPVANRVRTHSLNPGLTGLEPQALEDNQHYLRHRLQEVDTSSCKESTIMSISFNSFRIENPTVKYNFTRNLLL